MLAATIQALLVGSSLVGQLGAAYQPFPAHKVIGNVYYVGSKDLASYLITTPEGHILINSGFERDRAPDPEVGRVARLQDGATSRSCWPATPTPTTSPATPCCKELTGAKVYVMRGDDQVIASGGKGQYLYTDSRWKPCPVDRVLEDGDEVKLGGMTLVARLTPGHTRGCTTWTWRRRRRRQDIRRRRHRQPQRQPRLPARRQQGLPRDRRRLRQDVPDPQGAALRRLPRRPRRLLRHDREVRARQGGRPRRTRSSTPRATAPTSTRRRRRSATPWPRSGQAPATLKTRLTATERGLLFRIGRAARGRPSTIAGLGNRGFLAPVGRKKRARRDAVGTRLSPLRGWTS